MAIPFSKSRMINLGDRWMRIGTVTPGDAAGTGGQQMTGGHTEFSCAQGLADETAGNHVFTIARNSLSVADNALTSNGNIWVDNAAQNVDYDIYSVGY
jgi:hypothetical protein